MAIENRPQTSAVVGFTVSDLVIAGLAVSLPKHCNKECHTARVVAFFGHKKHILFVTA